MQMNDIEVLVVQSANGAQRRGRIGSERRN